MFEHLGPFWAAFNVLNESRMWTMGHPLPISLSEIKAYADIYNFEGEELHDLCTYVRHLDSVYLERQANKQAKKPTGKA